MTLKAALLCLLPNPALFPSSMDADAESTLINFRHANLHFRVCFLGKLNQGEMPGEADLPLSLPGELISVCLASTSHCSLLHPNLRWV